MATYSLQFGLALAGVAHSGPGDHRPGLAPAEFANRRLRKRNAPEDRAAATGQQPAPDLSTGYRRHWVGFRGACEDRNHASEQEAGHRG